MVKLRFLSLFLLPLVALLSVSVKAHSGLSLINETSSLHFISTKKSSVAEVHRFNEISGSVTDTGLVTIEIDLSSVDTSIEDRDQRMRDLLFETTKFSSATLTTNVNMDVLKTTEVGEMINQSVTAELSLHGQTKPVELALSIVKLSPVQYLVLSQKPVIINASDFELVAGVKKLMEAVNLPSISTAVPVTFSLIFEAHDH